MELFGFKSFDELVGFHCAPVLADLKPANLFALHHQDIIEINLRLEKYNELFGERGIVFRSLCSCRKRVLVLAFNRDALTKLLQEKGRRAYLIAVGYAVESTLEQDLQTLECRLLTEDKFPHEIGIFLGYPLEDVLGFVLNGGAGCKCSGYWKVYGDVERARDTFAAYEKCRSYILRNLSKGLSLHQAVVV